ncbi:uncharacterized protein LOC135371582 [Ornithodoros turicata]|uniref:uncharacterized protein LOC135371582 n=1 Tax=Ornithodoros turicata TaxID=34597 RepID=UPI00313977CF
MTTLDAAENFVRSLKQALRRAQAGKEEEPVGTFLAKYRATPHVSTGKSPCELLNKRLFRMTLDLVRPSRRESGDVVMPLTQNKSTRNFQVMEKVWVKDPTQKHHWIKGVVLGRIGNVIYDVDVEGKKRRRVHADHLKRRISADNVPNADVESTTRPTGRLDLPVGLAFSSRHPTEILPHDDLPASSSMASPDRRPPVPTRRYPVRRRRSPARFKFTTLGGRDVVDDDDVTEDEQRAA